MGSSPTRGNLLQAWLLFYTKRREKFLLNLAGFVPAILDFKSNVLSAALQVLVVRERGREEPRDMGPRQANLLKQLSSGTCHTT